MNVIKSDNSLDVETPAEKEKKIEWRNRRVDLIKTESGNYEIIVYKTRMRVSITGAIPISTQKPSFVIKLNNSSQINQESPSCFSIITDNKQAIDLVENINNGKRVIPTIIINGKSYSNPGVNGLMKILEQ